MTLIERIRELVAEGKTEQSIDELLDYVKSNDNSLLDRIILLKSRMHDLNEKILNGTIDDDDSSLQRARLNESVLKILHEVTPPYINTKKPTSQVHVSTTPKSSNKGLFIFLGVFFFFIVLVGLYMIGDDASDTSQAPTVNLGLTHFEHNVVWKGEYYMKIWQAGTIENATGRKGQIVTNFMMNGQPLTARYNDATYKNPMGYVATTSGPFQITSDKFELSRDTMLIPYSSFNLISTGGQTSYSIHLYTEVFIDDQPYRSSPWQPFVVNW